MTAQPSQGLGFALASLLTFGSFVQPTFGSEADGVPELVVLLAPEPAAPSPQQVVDGVNNRTPLPGALGSGSPVAAEPLLAERAQGDFLAWLLANPEDPRALLERYVVIEYASTTDLETAKNALAADSNVLVADEDGSVEPFLDPNDPLFPQSPGSQGPQWGLHLMNLPAAWEHTRGHGYAGIPDSGIEAKSPDCPGVTFETGHPDLRAFHRSGSTNLFEHGNFRRRLSVDVGNPNQPDRCVDELQLEEIVGGGGQFGVTDFAGHGSHVSGIVAATTDNGIGVAGTAWRTSLMFARISHLIPCTNVVCQQYGADVSQSQDLSDVAEGITWLIDHGTQVINMSFGSLGNHPSCASPPASWAPVCAALAHGANRQVLMAAASGNNASSVAFPARDSRVIAVGGLEFPGVFWDDGVGVGSNFGAQQELAAPAKDVVSTFYTGQRWNPASACQDAGYPSNPTGYGGCTGTSMAAPHVTGLASILRSIDPMLSSEEVRLDLRTHASQAASWDQFLGYGIPDADASVESLLGTVDGQVLANRATPLFSLYSSTAGDFFYTTVPQMAVAAIQDTTGVTYSSAGPAVPGYGSFPGCTTGSCPNGTPKASAWVLSTEVNPIPEGGALFPLYRLSKFAPFGGNPNHRDHRYAIDDAEVLAAFNAGYYLDGVEGYVFPTCGADTSCSVTSCQPAGTVPLLRRRNPAVDDQAVFPASELGSSQYAGYTEVVSSRACLGWVYANSDADADTVVDGFETLIGTDPQAADSDCDGTQDGAEILAYPRTDPLDGTCGNDHIFSDELDSGDTSAWSMTVVTGTGQLSVKDQNDLSGPWALYTGAGGSGDTVFVRDNTPVAEPRYRARFYLDPGYLSMTAGDQFYLFIVRSAAAAISRVAIEPASTPGSFRLQLRAMDDAGTWLSSGWNNFEDDTSVEIEWRAATAPGAADGYAKMWIDGGLVAHLSAIDNDAQSVEAALMGMVNGLDPGTFGALVFDAFVSRRTTYIGPLP